MAILQCPSLFEHCMQMTDQDTLCPPCHQVYVEVGDESDSNGNHEVDEQQTEVERFGHIKLVVHHRWLLTLVRGYYWICYYINR